LLADGPFEDCDPRDGWLLCRDQDRDHTPVALLLSIRRNE